MTAGPAARSIERVVYILVILLFGASGGLLWLIGYNYDGLTGSPLTKIHPFTYGAFAALFWRALDSGAPFSFFEEKLARRPAAVALLAVAILLVLAAVLRSGPGMAGFIDTFAGPAALALVLDDYDEAALARLGTLIHIMMAANALLGIFEFATSTLVFPYRFDGEAHIEDLRSTALQGHPLINAALTGVYVVCLMSSACGLGPAARASMILLQFGGLVVFGGRTAIVAALGLAPILALVGGWGVLKRGRVSLVAAAALFAILPLALAAVAFALQSGLADRLLMRFVDDNGSAASRVVMFDMLQPFSLGELLVGPDLDQVESLRVRLGLEQGVENPFVRMTVYQGAVATAIVFLTLAWFFRELTRGRGYRLLTPTLTLIILLNSSESISVKTNFLSKVVLMFVCLFPAKRAIRQVAVLSGPAPRFIAASLPRKLGSDVEGARHVSMDSGFRENDVV